MSATSNNSTARSEINIGSPQPPNLLTEYISISAPFNLHNEYDAITSISGQITVKTFATCPFILNFISSGKISNEQMEDIKFCTIDEPNICPIQFAVLVCTIWRISTINNIVFGSGKDSIDFIPGKNFDKQFSTLSNRRSNFSTLKFWKHWNLAHQIPDPF